MIPKFRAWDKELQTMLDVSLIDFKKGVLVGEHWKFGETNFMNFDEIDLMQSTGLFDRNGKEIFEGDVISTYTDNLVIKRDNLLGFYVELDEERNHFAETVDIEYLDLFAKDFGAAVQIIGNIYENPELLEEKE